MFKRLLPLLAVVLLSACAADGGRTVTKTAGEPCHVSCDCKKNCKCEGCKDGTCTCKVTGSCECKDCKSGKCTCCKPCKEANKEGKPCKCKGKNASKPKS